MFLLETERLSIRPVHILDDQALFQVFGDAEVMRFGDGPQTREWVKTWIQHCLSQYYVQWGFGPYAVVEKQQRSVIGYCGLFYFANIHERAEVEIGYRFARNQWGNGYATEAAQAVRDFAFSTLCIPRLVALIDPQNVSSIRVATKLGMTYECEVMLEGYDHPDHMYVLNTRP
jgi:[ribosomal protein S5]-alanine N-acetyltransferase